MNQGRLALWLPVAAILGDAAYFGLHAEPPLWLVPGCLVVAVAAVLVHRTRIALLVAGFAFGLGACQVATHQAAAFAALPTHATVVAGIIGAVEALPTGRRVSLTAVRLNGRPIGSRTIRLRLQESDRVELFPGEAIAVRARLLPPSAPAYPGGRDLQRDAYFSDLAGYASALGPVAVQSGPSRRPRWPNSAAPLPAGSRPFCRGCAGPLRRRC